MLRVLNGVFNDPALRRALLHVRFVLGAALLLPIAYYAPRSPLYLEFTVSLFGQAIQLWALAALVKNRQLTVRGPYALVRNPMYLGRFFLVLGFVMVTENAWVIGAYTALYWFYMRNRVRREEARLASLFGDAYRVYGERVNRFLPDLGKLGDPAVRYFDVAVLIDNNGHWNALLTLGMWAVLYLYI
jgi:hypothetical protein